MEYIPVFFQNEKVGELHYQDNDYQFIYDHNWTAFAISPAIPINGEVTEGAVERYLTNLFPEGDAFDVLVKSLNVRKHNVFAVLKAIGQDMSGGLVFGKTNHDDVPLRLITAEEITKRLDDGDDLLIWDGKYRLSLAGVQKKLNVLIQNKALYLADGQLASTHIMKFAKPSHRYLVANEFVCMRLAHAIGLRVAPVDHHYFGEHPALIVKRFDREIKNGQVNRYHVFDGCQALDLPPEAKYEQPFGSQRDVAHIRTGANLVDLFKLGDTLTPPIRARDALLDWTVFNLIIGNSDAHGKNISFMTTAFPVAPFYDLLSICFEAKQSNQIDSGLAMAIGDEFDPNDITAYDLLSCAEEVGIMPALIKRKITTITNRVFKEIDTLDLSDLNHGDRQYTLEMIGFIKERANYFVSELNEFDFVIEKLLADNVTKEQK